METAGVAAFGGDDGEEAGAVFIAGAAEDGILVMVPIAQFDGGVVEAEVELLGGFGAAAEEALAESLEVGGHEKDVAEGGLDFGVGGCTDMGGTLGVDIEDDVMPAAELVKDGGEGGAVEVVVDLGVFEESVGGDLLLEACGVEEMVIETIAFAGARGAGGAGDAEGEVGGGGNGLEQGGFARSGGSGENEEDAVAGGMLAQGDGPKVMLLNVLDLFADAFGFGFAEDDAFGEFGVGDFVGDGIEFAG